MYLVRRARGSPKRKETDMTNTTTTNVNTTVETAEVTKVTRKDALIAAMEKFDETDPVYVTLAKMLEQVTKPRNTNGETPSQAKAKAERAALITQILDVMRENPDVNVNSTWIAANVADVRTTQKATALMTAAIKDGLVEKYYSGKKVYYKLAH